MANTNPIKYFGGKELYDTTDVNAIAAETEQNAKTYTDSELAPFRVRDTEPTVGSANLIDSGTVATALQAKADEAYVDTQAAVALNAAKAYTDGEIASKQDALTFDEVPTLGSDNPVKSDGIAAVLDTKANLSDVISVSLLNQEKQERQDADTELQSNIDAEESARIDAVRFASVKVGETMFWSKTSIVSRVCISSDPFTWQYKGNTRSLVHIPSEARDLEIAINVPDGWLAMDGTSKAVSDYPELAAFFMPDNKIDDNHFWLPYVAKKIIKATY